MAVGKDRKMSLIYHAGRTFHRINNSLMLYILPTGPYVPKLTENVYIVCQTYEATLFVQANDRSGPFVIWDGINKSIYFAISGATSHGSEVVIMCMWFPISRISQ